MRNEILINELKNTLLLKKEELISIFRPNYNYIINKQLEEFNTQSNQYFYYRTSLFEWLSMNESFDYKIQELSQSIQCTRISLLKLELLDLAQDLNHFARRELNLHQMAEHVESFIIESESNENTLIFRYPSLLEQKIQQSKDEISLEGKNLYNDLQKKRYQLQQAVELVSLTPTMQKMWKIIFYLALLTTIISSAMISMTIPVLSVVLLLILPLTKYYREYSRLSANPEHSLHIKNNFFIRQLNANYNLGPLPCSHNPDDIVSVVTPH